MRLILVGPDSIDRMDQLPLPSESAPAPDGPLLIESDTAIDALITLGLVGPIWLSQPGELQHTRKFGIVAGLFGQRQVICDSDALPSEQRLALIHSLGRHSILISRRPALWSGFGKKMRRLRAVASTQADRQHFWQALVGPALNRADLAPLLAGEQSTPLIRLWRLAQEAVDVTTLEVLLRHERSEPMQGLADRIPPRFSFDDLELPARSLARLRGFAARRASEAQVLEDWGLGAALGAGRGAIALFLGPSGTGKTMAASVMAQEAGLDLWRINLATTVSKYIGETEANLDRIFRAADRAEVMLFFDEAEALFSKRAEVKEARDRYANMEMAYLLQRIEDFRGMAVLASNMGTSLEPAMLRRFDLVLEFTLPDTATRRRLWSRIETSSVPLASDVDLDLLAGRFELAGGHIRQAILSAAHEAVDEGQVTQMHLLRAVAREYVKLGRPLRKEDFGSSFAQMRGQP
ncbi:ATP-binding protein [Nitrincola sp. A-D6]|uniref:ATP-binding protein n=1 Tax=Nitrincola sp. A-D6 TaxID=1545442 RepID=UPI0006911855|nr:ATP-binding protein [Nitrincola sp. A-D6]